jgi:hypothetical protein
MEIDITKTIEQKIKGKISKPEITLTPLSSGQYTARVTFNILNDVGAPVELIRIDYDVTQWNEFWNNFNSGKFLLEELKKVYSLDNLIIPDDIESWFVN